MEKAGDILNALFERLQVHDEHGYVRLFSTWRTVCDEVSSRGLADHSSIIDVRKGALIVAVDHSGWMQIIQMYEKRLLEKLQQRFPEMGLTAIHFRVSDRRVDFLSRGERSEPETDNAAEKDFEQPKPAKHAKTSDGHDSQRTLSGIENERLRQSLERLREDLEERDGE